MSLLRVLLRLTGFAGGVLLGLRLHWFRQPRPWPRQLAAWLDSGLRLRGLDPASLLDPIGVQPGMHVLEVGCGTGVVTEELARRAGEQGTVTALDIQMDLVRRAQRRLGEAGLANRVRFLCADVAGAPLDPESVDLIVLGSVLGEIPDPHPMLVTLFGVARPGSRLAVYEEPLMPGALPPAMAQMHLHAAGFRRGGHIRQLTHWLAVYYRDGDEWDPDLTPGTIL